MSVSNQCEMLNSLLFPENFNLTRFIIDWQKWESKGASLTVATHGLIIVEIKDDNELAIISLLVYFKAVKKWKYILS